MATVSLKKMIQKYVDAHPEYNHQAGALYQCDWATQDFIGWLKDNYPTLAKWHKVREYTFYISEKYSRKYGDTLRKSGVFNPDPALYCEGKNENGDRKSEWHCIVETKDFYIDFTARQYTKEAAYPHIISKRQLVMAATAGAK